MTLREDLRAALPGRVATVGVGNPDLGDDGAGVRLAEALAARGVPDVLAAERTPERWLGRLAGERFEAILFLDAVDAGLPAGDVLLMDAATIQARFPQVSTHRLSLGVLARLLETEGGTRVVLLGIQPASLALGAGLSTAVGRTLQSLADLLTDVLVSRRSPTADLGPRTSDLGHRGAHP
jgi:hydrogenase maturation protease